MYANYKYYVLKIHIYLKTFLRMKKKGGRLFHENNLPK